MKALVYHGPGERAWESVPDPEIQEPADVVVRIDSSTICGTDLHILRGDVPEVKPGTILGHEAIGTAVETGSGVTTLAEGDRVLVSCITSCGRRLDPTPFATHRFELSEAMEAYDVFAAAAHTNALKVVLSAQPVHLPPVEEAETLAGAA